jgi:hypothetical protein
MEVEELATIVTNGLKDLSTRMDQGFAQVDARFEQVDARFEQVDARFAGVEGRLTGVEGRLTGVEGRLIGVEGRLTTVEEDVHKTRILVEGLTDAVKQVGEGVVAHHAELRRHVADTDRRFDDIESVFRNYRAARRKRATGRAKPSR